MKTFLIITLAVEIFQLIVLLSVILTDLTMTEDNLIKTKKGVIQFFIPYFWLIPLLRAINKWWKSLG